MRKIQKKLDNVFFVYISKCRKTFCDAEQFASAAASYERGYKQEGINMSAIGMAKQVCSDRVEVYDENGNYKFSKSGQLMGFTSTTVSIDVGSNRIEVYDDDGNYKFSK